MAFLIILQCSFLFAQSSAQPVYANLTEHLRLNASQVTGLQVNIQDLDRSWRMRQREVQRIGLDIGAETRKPIPNELALGRLYADIEGVCRGAREDEKRTRDLNVGLLNQVQKERLRLLEEARRLAPVIASGQSLLLLPEDAGNLISPFNYPVGTPASLMPGCVFPISLRTEEPEISDIEASEYLNLTTSQSRALFIISESMLYASYDYFEAISGKQEPIAIETDRPVIDTAALGKLYGEVEAVCREW